MQRFGFMIIMCAPLFLAAPTDAGLQEFEDKAAWEATVGDFSTVDFTGYPDNTPVTDQWSHLGITFTDFNVTSGPDEILFPEDSWGLQGFTDIHVEFAKPMSQIAADFPGEISFELFMNDTLVATSSAFGGSGEGFFGGLISTQPFNRARIFDSFDGIASLDDLHFGPPIPAPPALAPLAFGLFIRASRRRGR